MVLVDTSIWIEVLRKTRPPDLEAVVSFDDVVTCRPIAQEVLESLIAACAIQHRAVVHHRDRDYPQLAKVSALREREP